jgi:large subunit ribosomal protein L24
MKLKTGDRVMVIAGKDAGTESTIERVYPNGRVLVEGVNTAKKHQKALGQQTQGGIIDRDMPIDASNVMIVCSKCGPTRIGFRFDDKGKHRICRKCGGDLK